MMTEVSEWECLHRNKQKRCTEVSLRMVNRHVMMVEVGKCEDVHRSEQENRDRQVVNNIRSTCDDDGDE
jgi:hypothetical protein